MRETIRDVLLLAALAVSITTPARAAEYDPSFSETYRVDSLRRILEVSGRRSIPCPKQTDRTGVFLILSQSNAANYGEARFRTAHPAQVVNFFAGQCFPAVSPLVGTDGLDGESWTPLADKLIGSGLFGQVILITSAIGGSEVARWQEGGDLNRMLLDVIKDVQKRYRITHVLWHQGESDLILKTSARDYTARFASLVQSLRRANISAPVFASIASKCLQVETWAEEDAVTAAQRGLADPAKGIFPGPDTNALITPRDRSDNCHFAESGQMKFVEAWAEILGRSASGKR